MNSVRLIAIASCIAAICGCSGDKETKTPDLGRRYFEARLVGAPYEECRAVPLQPGKVVQKVECPAEKPAASAACDEVLTYDDARTTLIARPQCIDRAIDALVRIAPTSPQARNDLAVAYYSRGQQKDDPVDLLHAATAALQALDKGPRFPEAQFNLARAYEALGLYDDAIAAWNAFLQIESDRSWAAEARRRRDRMILSGTADAPKQWAANMERLRAALKDGNDAAVSRLIAPFPASAQRFFENELLPAWAGSDSAEHLKQVRLLAEALSRRTDDPFFRDTAEAIARASPAQRTSLRQAHVLLQQAAMAAQNFDPTAAEASFRKAAAAFERGGSPLRFRAQLGLAIALMTDDNPRALDILTPLERELSDGRYPHFLARVRSNRAQSLFNAGRYLDALALQESVLAEYLRRKNFESYATTLIRHLGVLRVMGNAEDAWRETALVRHYADHVASVNDRHLFLGETTNTAQDLGHPRLALLYQNAAMRLAKAEQDPRVAVALRERAAIELELGNLAAASRDIREAARRARGLTDEKDRRAVQGRIAEVQGQVAMATGDLNGAVAAFSEALTLTAGDEYPSLVSSIRTQRAAAYQQAGRGPLAEADLLAALAILRKEEEDLLEGRRRGSYEHLWAAYFSRFRKTYESLIRHLVEDGRPEEAFVYNERARAFEPLNLLLQVKGLPEATRQLASGASVAAYQAMLPRGTFVLQYMLFDDRTYVWIVSSAEVRLLTLGVRRSDVERWSDGLHEAARKYDRGLLEPHLSAAYDGLLAPALRVVEARRDRREPARLVLVPDEAMNALPFAALRDPVRAEHLVEQYVHEIAASTTLYAISLLRDRTLMPSWNLLLAGDPIFNRALPIAADLEQLTHARAEVSEIAALYDSDSRAHIEDPIGAEATVARFLALAKESAVVHFAGHSVIIPAEPYRSSLLLTPSNGDDGALEAQELLTRVTLDRTRLVVLSSCKSAGGAPIRLEGVAPLVRPIIAAGVPGVVGSVWDVNDATTKPLMVSFHRAYQQGADAARALQAAQLEMLRSNTAYYRSVFAWGSFQVIGHASSPFGPPKDEKEKHREFRIENPLQRSDGLRTQSEPD